MSTDTLKAARPTRLMGRFADRFIGHDGAPIGHDGRRIHLAYRIPVARGDEIDVALVRAAAHPRQAATAGGGKCTMKVGTKTVKPSRLSDGISPPVARFTIGRGRSDAYVSAMNS